jgi:hypothetical protein
MEDKDKMFWQKIEALQTIAEILDDSINRLYEITQYTAKVLSDSRAAETEYHLRKRLGQLNEDEFQKEERRKKFTKEKENKNVRTKKAGIKF